MKSEPKMPIANVTKHTQSTTRQLAVVDLATRHIAFEDPRTSELGEHWFLAPSRADPMDQPSRLVLLRMPVLSGQIWNERICEQFSISTGTQQSPISRQTAPNRWEGPLP
jgi:hypothetical protein